VPDTTTTTYYCATDAYAENERQCIQGAIEQSKQRLAEAKAEREARRERWENR
jgi:hypothetical protein